MSNGTVSLRRQEPEQVADPRIGRPVVTRGPKQRGGLPKCDQTRQNTPFDYKHHPEAWGWGEFRGGFYPQIRQFRHDPGGGNVGEFGETSAAEVSLHQKGWSILQHDDERLDRFQTTIHGRQHSGGTFVMEYAVQGGGTVYKTIFERAEVIGNKVTWVKDEGAYQAFLDWLQTPEDEGGCGWIKPIHPAVKLRILRKHEHSLDTILKAMAREPNGHNRGRYKEQRIRVGQIRGEDMDRVAEEIAATTERAVAQVTAIKPQPQAPADNGDEMNALRAQLAAQQEQIAALRAKMTPDADTTPSPEERLATPVAVQPKRKRGRPKKDQSR